MADRSGLGGIPVTGLIAVLVAIVGAVLWKSVPLEVQRPGVSAPIPYQEVGLQDIDARLWEDPFAAVARAIDGKTAPDERRLLPKVCERVRERVKGNVKLLVLGVMVSKAPYADGEEQRRRIRYAVVSALNVAHFVPENAEHVGYLRWNGDGTIPFELFRRKNRSKLGFDLVAMVLWLEDETFSSVHAKGVQTPAGAATPVLRLNQLALDLKNSCSTHTDVLDSASYQFQAVGPAQSSSLKAMIEEMDREPELEAQIAYTGRPRLTHVEFYSPFATASETELLRRRRTDEPAARDALQRGPCRSNPREPGCTLNRFFAGKGLRFLQTTSSDDLLTRTLVDELELRGVPVRTGSSPAHHVALISEWDTYYGRMLPSAFMRVAGLERVCETDLSEPQPLESERNVECRILRFSYLRGLDGLAPGGSAPSTQAKAKSGAHSSQPVELADSPKQFDYVRRLATQIFDENIRLQRAGLGEIGAVGVLGSDVYDKIAVLRALRPNFPRAVFFTTDLDARLLNPEEYDWTRNLIVASGFGLQLAPCLQRHIPPFRGSYQTAAFFATRVALYNAFPGANTYRYDRCPEEAWSKPLTAAAVPLVQARLDQWLAAPRLYELGRTRAIDLRDPAGGCPGLAECADIHAHGGDLHNVRGLLAAFALLALLLGLLFLSRVTRPVLAEPVQLIVDAVRGRILQGQRLRVLLPAALFIAFLAMLLQQMFASVNDASGEPFAWLEGVSAWPSEVIRWFALLLGACFLVYMFRATQRNDMQLQESFHIPFADDTRTFWQRIRGRFHAGDASAGMPRTAALWSQYMGSGTWSLLILWAVVWTVAFMCLSSALFALLGLPNHPIRGAAALRLDRMLIMALVMIFLVLLFSVNAAIRLCGRFIDELIAHNDARDWPDDARRMFAKRIGFKADIDPELAGDILDPWIDIHFIAQRTQAIGPLIYFPFVLLSLMVVARWSVFDDWDIPIALAIVFMLGFAIACVNAFLMQRAATRARALALERLQALQLQSKGQAPGAYPIPAHLDAIAESVRSLRKGAFVPFTEQPLVRGALIPFGSAGGLYLVDLFALASS
jgi:hypothetical protein